MKYLFYECIVTFHIVSAFVSSYTIPDATVNILKPKGFRISIPHEDGISEVSFNVKINQRINLYQPGDFAAIIRERTNDVWAFDNINTSVKPSDAINYWVHVQFENGKNLRDVGIAIVSEDSVEIFNFCAAVGQESVVDKKVECEKSETTIGGKQVCKGELIFEDNFEILDWTKWSREVRIPFTSDDGQFVMFLDKSKNCYAKNGQLHIIPSLTSEVLGNNLTLIRTGEYNLGAQCTAILDKSQECRRKAQFYHILPPVVSARINTRDSFSFRYGRIEVKAKLPKGDWLFPLILLEPLENYYGIQHYMSGQMRVAFNRGNEILLDANFTDISNKWLSGGVVMTTLEEYRDNFLRGTETHLDLSLNMHTYSLTWMPGQFILAMDGKDYARNFKDDFSKWQAVFHGSTRANNMMAPFDREFYLALGVAAGGHSDFPDRCKNGFDRSPKPWTNGDPKAELFFWRDFNNWSKTWNADSSGLHVDYVKVYAL